jgi:hypothetical protein
MTITCWIGDAVLSFLGPSALAGRGVRGFITVEKSAAAKPAFLTLVRKKF